MHLNMLAISEWGREPAYEEAELNVGICALCKYIPLKKITGITMTLAPLA